MQAMRSHRLEGDSIRVWKQLLVALRLLPRHQNDLHIARLKELALSKEHLQAKTCGLIDFVEEYFGAAAMQQATCPMDVVLQCFALTISKSDLQIELFFPHFLARSVALPSNAVVSQSMAVSPSPTYSGPYQSRRHNSSPTVLAQRQP